MMSVLLGQRRIDDAYHAGCHAQDRSDDHFFLLIGIFNFGLDDTGSTTVFASKLRTATLVVAVLEDVGGVATGATMDGGF